MCDIWCVRNPKTKCFTFSLKAAPLIRVYSKKTSNSLQDFVNKTEVLVALFSDHSRLIFALSLMKEEMKGNNGLWKINNSLTMDSDFIVQIKIHKKIQKVLTMINLGGNVSHMKLEKFQLNILKSYLKLQQNKKSKFRKQAKIKKSTKILQLVSSIFNVKKTQKRYMGKKLMV